MNQFGGEWTRAKIEILVEYAKAYLTIMKNRGYFKLLYFDGFAGSGFIINNEQTEVHVTVGAARRIIELNDPVPFDMYYFVEKSAKSFALLEKNTREAFPKKEIYTAKEDCNKKLIDLANFLRKPENKNYRTLAYIDPCGMQVEWRSIECLRDLPIDMWVLVPTGLGVNRLLTKNGHITEAWLNRLERFLGMPRDEIEAFFYQRSQTLFPDVVEVRKEERAVQRSAELYRDRLQGVFKHVSQPFELKNTTGSVMYHLFLAAKNQTAVKIGNDIVKKYS